MPLGDKTGPRGLGPRTGRGLGGCSPKDFPDILKDIKPVGLGMRQRRGLGRGRGIGQFGGFKQGRRFGIGGY